MGRKGDAAGRGAGFMLMGLAALILLVIGIVVYLVGWPLLSDLLDAIRRAAPA